MANGQNNPVEYTVMKIDKTKGEKRLLNSSKWFSRAGVAYLVYTAVVMAAATGLGLSTVGLLTGAIVLGKFSKKIADLSWEKRNQIDQMKQTITQDQYKMYHKSSKPVQKVNDIKQMIKNRKIFKNNSGFKP